MPRSSPKNAAAPLYKPFYEGHVNSELGGFGYSETESGSHWLKLSDSMFPQHGAAFKKWQSETCRCCDQPWRPRTGSTTCCQPEGPLSTGVGDEPVPPGQGSELQPDRQARRRSLQRPLLRRNDSELGRFQCKPFDQRRGATDMARLVGCSTAHAGECGSVVPADVELDVDSGRLAERLPSRDRLVASYGWRGSA